MSSFAQNMAALRLAIAPAQRVALGYHASRVAEACELKGTVDDLPPLSLLRSEL